MREGLGELELIERIRRGVTVRGRRVRLGIGDDCAILRVRAGEEMVVTTDLCLEGRHFRRDWHTAESAGWRCLARGLSDVAAMGGRPVAAFLSLGLPTGFELGWVDGFMAGFGALAERHGVELAGGDTAEAVGEGVVADVVVVGAVQQGRALRRGTAGAGDGVYVTGRLGGAAAELARMAGGELCPRRAGEDGMHPQAFPEPRVAVGQALLRRGIATSCMDLSDGLSSDLAKLCGGAELEEEAIPRAAGATLGEALDGGEDYELLFTARRKVPGRIAGVEVTRIGRVVKEGYWIVERDGQRRVFEAGGWEHFRE